EPAGLHQLHPVPLVSGSMHDRLHIGEPVAECSSYSQGVALERKEADDLAALLQDRELHVRTSLAHDGNKLWSKEGTGQGVRRALEGMPELEIAGIQFRRPTKRRFHSPPRNARRPRAPRGSTLPCGCRSALTPNSLVEFRLMPKKSARNGTDNAHRA